MLMVGRDRTPTPILPELRTRSEVMRRTTLGDASSTKRPILFSDKNFTAILATFPPNEKAMTAPGTFLRIRLADGSFGYGVALEPPYFAFYNLRAEDPLDDLHAIESSPVLFKQAVRLSGVRNWTKIGKRPLTGTVAEPVVRYTQDLLDYKKCVIFDSLGNEREATPEECVGIEQAAVWEARGVEERLLDTFLGRENEEEVRSRVRLSPSSP
jgi:hypothetical protein